MENNIEQLKYPIGRYQKPEQATADKRAEWIRDIKALPAWMDASIENLDEAQLEAPYREGGWNIRQVVHHVADSHMNAFIRLKLALTEDNPTIKPYNETAWAELVDSKIIPVNVSVTMIHAIHRRLLAILEHMKDADWDRTYYHPDHKRNFPIWELAALYAWHGRHHTAHIKGLRERMGWSY